MNRERLERIAGITSKSAAEEFEHEMASKPYDHQTALEVLFCAGYLARRNDELLDAQLKREFCST